MPLAPCKNCPDRWVNETTSCHATCEKYLAFEAQRKRLNEARALEKELRGATYAIQWKGREVARKR